MSDKSDEIKVRLDKILADSCLGSRNEVKQKIKSGMVSIDGAICRNPAQKVCYNNQICIGGIPVRTREFIYIMMNKPSGVVSATDDKREKTAISILPERYQNAGLFPAGRLDKDTEGFLLITNDGHLGHSITSPRRHVDKLYLVITEKALESSDIQAFSSGIELDDGFICKPAGMKITGECQCIVTLREGKFHQVKRMMQSIGKPLVYLKRIEIGGVKLDPALEPGGWRELTDAEILTLRQISK